MLQTQFGNFGVVVNQDALINIILPNNLKSIEAKTLKTKSTLMIKAMSQLDQYFRGFRQLFDLKIDLSITAFSIDTLEEIKNIPYAHTRSYKEIAYNIKSPKGHRAVANATARNPIPIIIPCHRVIKSSGDLGGYSGSSILKKKLIEFEKNIKVN